MNKISNFQGTYSGSNTINGATHTLFLYISIDEMNNGSTSRKYRDMISADIYCDTDTVRKKVPYSFRCEEVFFTKIKKGIAFECVADTTYIDSGPFFLRQNIKLNITVQIEEKQGKISIKEKDTDASNFFEFLIEKIDQDFYRSLSVEFASEVTFLDKPVLNPLPSVVEVFKKAGIEIKLYSPALRFLDTDVSYPWSTEEINDLMEILYPETVDCALWPRWKCYVLVLSQWRDYKGAVGVTFDNRIPFNQGIAIFAEHTKLQPKQPATDMNCLYVWVHELAHLLGLSHSSNPQSWMYERLDDALPHLNNSRSFSDYEISELRHNFTVDAIPGYRKGMAMLYGDFFRKPGRRSTRLELTIKSYGIYYIGEPVELELRIRNRSIRHCTICPCLEPEGGLVYIEISRQGEGKWETYIPYNQYNYAGELLILQPANYTDGQSGSDRFSQWISVSDGENGIALFQPGKYSVRAYYQFNRIKISSEEHSIELCEVIDGKKIKLGHETSKELSTYLHNNMRVINNRKNCQPDVEYILNAHPVERVRARYAFSLACSIGDKRRLFIRKGDMINIEYDTGNIKRALELCENTISFFEKSEKNTVLAKMENLAYRKQVEWYMHFLRQSGQMEKADKVLKDLKRRLEIRMVKPAVLEKM